MVLKGGGDNHELGGNYSYYVTLIVYLSTKLSELSEFVGFWSNLLEMCSVVKNNSSDQFCAILFVFFVSCLSPVLGWSVFLSIFLLFLFVSVCENHRGLFSHVVCVPFLSVFVASVC
jgi:hypothetical protein